jgi:hypothetical protein
MPASKSKYSPDWKAISQRIRFERAGGKCEWCGIPNRAVIQRLKSDPHIWREDTADDDPAWLPKTRITLTVAHLNHDTTDNTDDNLAALCNRCHLNHDAKFHAENARKTRQRKAQAERKASGQLELDLNL